MKTQTLVDRIYAREAKSVNGVPLSHHIRAELQRVARRVRKLEHTVEKLCGNEHCGDKKCNVVYVKRKDVLALLRKAMR